MRFLRNILLIAALTSAPTFAFELDKSPEQGGLLFGIVAPGTQLLLDDKPVRVTPSGRFVIGFDRDAKPTATLIEISSDGRRTAHTLQVAQRKYAIQSVTGVPQQTVEPPPEQLQRILEEKKLVDAARAVNSDRLDFLVPMQWPLLGPISGVYGSQRIYNGTPGRPHFGVDVAAQTGTAVRAPADAIVTLAHPDMFFSGGTLIMDHGYGVSSTFMHLSRLLVKTGAAVKAGDVVGEVGATGRASGPHLDWRMNWFDVRIDPQLVVEPMPSHATVSSPNQGSSSKTSAN